MIVTKRQVSRRALLRGAGAVIGLPFLDAMRPALAAPGGKQARRIGVVYVPNGIIMRDWQVKKIGTGFDFPRILKPLERFREDIVVVSGLSNHAANKAKGGGHAKASGSFLSGGRDNVRSDCRAEVRARDAGAVVAVRLRGFADDRQLRYGVELRVYEHDLLEEPGYTDGGGGESAVGV